MTITVTQEGRVWVARMVPFSYADKDVIKAAGFRFDGQRKVWFTQDAAVAQRLAGGGAQAAQAINNARLEQHRAAQAAIAQSRAATSDFRVPLSATCRAQGLDFLPFQRAGIEYALGCPNGALIADEMGVGKTIQAMGVANADPSINRILAIVPASLKLNWELEANRWLARDIPVRVANGEFPSEMFQGWGPGGAQPAGMVITNYEMVEKHRQAIDAVAWDMLICDEAHMLKNSKAQRTVAILGRRDFKNPQASRSPIMARKRLFLTGTPILNRPEELWTMVHTLDPMGLGRNWKAFVVRYCAGRQEEVARGRLAWNTKGASNLDELQARLRATCMVRRLKSEVLTELPAKSRMIVALKAETREAIEALREEEQFAGQVDAIVRLSEAIAKLDPKTQEVQYNAAVASLHNAQKVAFTDTSRVRHRIALAKVPQVISHVEAMLEGTGEKVIVFAHHHEVMDALEAAFKPHGVMRCDGRDSNEDRHQAVQAFQRDPAIRVIVCSIGAMGVGHTLTASPLVIFAETAWTPGACQQAEDRAHRIGQGKPVLIQYVVLNGSLDAKMLAVVVGKANVISEALDAGQVALPVPELLAVPVEVAPRIDARGPAEPQDERKAVSAIPMPPEQIAAVHASLRFLAGMCDGALRRDDVGFNGTDARFGHSLANNERLTQNAAKWGRKILRKYHRQVPADLYDAAMAIHAGVDYTVARKN